MSQKHVLDKLIICKKCHSVYERVALSDKNKAFCTECNVLLYQNNPNIINRNLALITTAIIFLFNAFNFNIVSINIQGLEQSLNLTSFFMVLLEEQQYIVGILFVFMMIIFPISSLLLRFSLLLLMKFKKKAYLSKRLLILLSHLEPWNMLDIFFISLLVAMVKLFDVANIEPGIAFIAFVLTLVLDVIITKSISFYELWELHEKTYGYTDEK